MFRLLPKHTPPHSKSGDPEAPEPRTYYAPGADLAPDPGIGPSIPDYWGAGVARVLREGPVARRDGRGRGGIVAVEPEGAGTGKERGGKHGGRGQADGERAEETEGGHGGGREANGKATEWARWVQAGAGGGVGKRQGGNWLLE